MFKRSFRLGGFLSETRGVAALEFALVAPLFLALIIGSFLAFDIVRGIRQTSLAATVAVDLTTRSLTMNDSTRDSIFFAAQATLGKYASNSNFIITITSIYNELGNGDDDLAVRWSETNTPGNEMTTEDLENLSLPTIPDGESVIYVAISTDYTPVWSSFWAARSTISRTAVRRPRFVLEILYQ